MGSILGGSAGGRDGFLPSAGAGETPIVGIAPAAFAGVWADNSADIWIPLLAQSEVRYFQNFSASNSQPMRPWAPQEGIEETLQMFAREKLAGYKCPRWISVIPELPKTATGKIQRFLLRVKV